MARNGAIQFTIFCGVRRYVALPLIGEPAKRKFAEKHHLLYRLAFLEGDKGMMAKIVASTPNFERATIDLEAYLGHVGKLRELSRVAADAALRAGAKEDAAHIAASAALW